MKINPEENALDARNYKVLFNQYVRKHGVHTVIFPIRNRKHMYWKLINGI